VNTVAKKRGWAACSEEQRIKFEKLRDWYYLESRKVKKMSPIEHEWTVLSREHRIVFLMLAGVDGDVDILADRDWRELNPVEERAVKSAIRQMKNAMSGIVALARK
jgi:hypothetical protein